MFTRKSWKNDWKMFVKEVGALFAGGFTDERVSAEFAERPVVWIGILANKDFHKRLGNAELSGVQMDMPPVDLALPDGRHTRVDYLFLTLRDAEIACWQDIPIGTTVSFSTKIGKAPPPFPGISWFDLGDKKGTIRFLTDGAKPIGS